MTSATVNEWRSAVRSRIDGWQYHFDGTGQHATLHATVFQVPHNGRRAWAVEVMEDVVGERAEDHTYGRTCPLTFRMAREIARRFVTGRKIPKRLEWR